MMKISNKSKSFIEIEHRFGAHNYHPLDVVISKGEGIYVWDVEGKRYFDFLSAYSAVNQGHCNKKILSALTEQAKVLTLTSRAFYNDKLGPYEMFMSSVFGYDKLLPMNSGAEGVETALKLARRWGYDTKKIDPNNALIIVCEGNFHGRTITAVSLSNDPSSYAGYGPLTEGFIKIPYNSTNALEEALNKYGKRVAGFMLEPIQGEAGVIVPDEGYLRKCKSLCEKYGVLFIADEIQTGIGRTGKMLCCDHEDVRADILILGKALSGGFFPVSAVLADDEVMLNIKPGEHGSTFGGSPLSCSIGMAAIEVIIDEKLSENAFYMGRIFRERLSLVDSPLIGNVRGKGLLNAITIKPYKGIEAWDVCEKMAENGLLAKPTHKHTIRFAPPLIITEAELNTAIDIIEKSLNDLIK